MGVRVKRRQFGYIYAIGHTLVVVVVVVGSAEAKSEKFDFRRGLCGYRILVQTILYLLFAER